jgi:protease-4
VVDPQARDLALIQQPEDESVRILEDLLPLHAEGGEIIDVEEPAVVDLVRRDAPVGEAEVLAAQELVDQLTTQDEFRAIMVERGAADEEEHTFRQVALEDYLGFVDREKLPLDPRPQVAVVVAQGEIVDGDQPPGLVGGLSTAELVRDAREDEHVKALVLRVDSPGGGVFPSEQIRREIALTKDAGKPVVVSMGNVAASGGYWISMNADRIYADPSTITGSIGIFGVIPTLPRALGKIGVHTDGVGTTRFAGAFDITRPLDPAVGDIVQSVIDKGYRDFTARVAQARHREIEDIDAIARGRVWTGAQARERGLVDDFGGLQAAVEDAAKRAKLDKPDAFRVRYMEPEVSPFERFFANFVESRAGSAWLRESAFAQGLARIIAGGAVPQMASDFQFLDAAMQRRPGMPVKALAYCFCEL